MRIALAGNPNSGKSTIFNHLTGLRQKVANYPGVTVEAHVGHFTLPEREGIVFELIDIPGCYSLSAVSPDEFIAVEALIGRAPDGSRTPPDLVVIVLDATTLERGLYLLSQVSQAQLPTIVVLNQIDIAERRQLRINATKLAERIGAPVISAVASKGRGLDHLRRAIADFELTPPLAPLHTFDSDIESFVSEFTGPEGLTRPELFRAIFDRRGPAEALFGRRCGSAALERLEALRESIAEKNRGLPFGEAYPLALAMNDIAEQTRERLPERRRAKSDKLDAVALHRFWGPVILLAVMALMFQSIFTWAEPLMNWIDSGIGALGELVGSTMSDGALRSLIVDGVIGGVGSVLVFLPQIVILFLFLGALEDSGYLPRAAFIVDRLFRWCGLSGKSFVPLLSSFACAIPGIMATRVIEAPRQRLLTILVAPLMSCSARLPVYTVMIAAFIPYESYFGVFNSRGLTLTALYALGVLVAIVVSSVLKATALKGGTDAFVMELPTFKAPTFSGIWIRTSISAKAFLKRAGTLIFAITIIIWALSYYPRSSEVVADYDARITQLEEQIGERLTVAARALGPDVTPENFDAESERALQSATGDTLFRLNFAVRMYTTIQTGGDSLLERLENEKAGALLRESFFGRLGRTLEPLFAPLGWDWKITMAALASFPAREVVIATLGTIYNLGEGVDESSRSLIEKLQTATWDSGARAGQPVFSPAVALSIMVFFALCCQCGATLAVIRRETNSWKWPAFTFGYMTVLAYLGSLLTYNIFASLGV
ncbi:MAG TPA: ferrous iron transport protein B [candidate division Zixibacteria bacterium]|nr:ferrous iron transport protein B [candidate division Zixibacteria bacterium]